MELLVNRGEKWTDNEDKQLLEEYNDNINILTIGKTHGRTPGACAARLKQLGIINHTFEANGYDEYVKSDIYKNIVSEKKENKKRKTEKRISKELKNKVLITIDQNNYEEMQNTIDSVQEDVTTIYKKILKLENKMDYIIKLLESANDEKEESQEDEQYVEIKNKTYIIKGTNVYYINEDNTTGKLYGYYNFETNKVKKAPAEIEV